MKGGRTQGLLYCPMKSGASIRTLIRAGLQKDRYRHWQEPFPGLYVPQTGELKMFTASEHTLWTMAHVADPGEIHSWALRTSVSSPDVPFLSLYIEPTGYWNAKLFIGGVPTWKTRDELDREVPYPVPLLSAAGLQRSLAQNEALRNTLPPLSEALLREALGESNAEEFQNAWKLPKTHESPSETPATVHPEEIWLDRESPLLTRR